LRVVVLGDSSNSDRYSCMTFMVLMKKGYEVILVNFALEKLEKFPVAKKLSEA
jgi:predicted CoA-binding protein